MTWAALGWDMFIYCYSS